MKRLSRLLYANLCLNLSLQQSQTFVHLRYSYQAFYLLSLMKTSGLDVRTISEVLRPASRPLKRIDSHQAKMLLEAELISKPSPRKNRSRSTKPKPVAPSRC